MQPGRSRWLVTRLLSVAVASVVAWSGPAHCVLGASVSDGPAFYPGFRADEAGASFRFETESIEGALQVEGVYHGVTRLIDKRSGRQVIDTRYSALNLFKLMSVNQVMDLPRAMQRTATSQAGAVEIQWPPSEGHHAGLTARYELRPPNAIDLTVTVKSRGTYAGYELFLSSYFDKALRPHVMVQAPRNQPAEWVLPTVNDVFRGTVLVFPRDALAARFCLDGRWSRSERKTPTVQMCPVRHYAHCLAVQEDPHSGLAAVLMSYPEECYAISTRYHAAEDADRLTSYSAFDLSLFGVDLVPRAECRARVRLALLRLDGDWGRALDAYREFLVARQTESSSAGCTPTIGVPP